MFSRTLIVLFGLFGLFFFVVLLGLASYGPSSFWLGFFRGFDDLIARFLRDRLMGNLVDSSIRLHSFLEVFQNLLVNLKPSLIVLNVALNKFNPVMKS